MTGAVHEVSSGAWTDVSVSRTAASSCTARESPARLMGRGRGRSTSTRRATDPGRGVMTAIRSARRTASGTECVTRITVRGRSSQSDWSSVSKASRLRASSAEKGSSSSSTGGSPISARARPARCAIPPDSSRGRMSAASARPTRASASRARSLRSAGRLAMQGQGQRNVVERRQPWQEARLLEGNAHPAVTGSGRPARIAADRDLAAIRAQQAGDQPQQRRLAAAVGADHHREAAGRHLERASVQRHQRSSARGKADGRVLDADRLASGAWFAESRHACSGWVEPSTSGHAARPRS